MARPRIALLNASADANTPRNFRRELAADLAEFDATANQLPRAGAFDAAVVTGSTASVYWDEPWIDDLVAWLADATGRVPILGVCFGHQALAAALGGAVEAMDDMEIGYRAIRRTGDSRLLDGLDPEFVSFTTHGDAVVDLPPDASRIAANDYGIQGFRLGDAFGVQFHPEYDLETAREITRGKDLPAERKERVLAGITEERYDAACGTKRLFDNFLGLVAERGVESPGQ